ncbi:hypothetical protein IQ07DRAFT_628910 [Pyrenochaeta sp. DS3sAY3a]|nr:hypothetical protein IQ07DRAFT_628910 [Pyrenochaeta sp. DS3sAY3a]
MSKRRAPASPDGEAPSKKTKVTRRGLSVSASLKTPVEITSSSSPIQPTLPGSRTPSIAEASSSDDEDPADAAVNPVPAAVNPVPAAVNPGPAAVNPVPAAVNSVPAAVNPKAPAKKSKLPSVKDQFTQYKPQVTLPPASPFWGVTPVTGDPRPAPNQPDARSSNGATIPPMWEDRKWRFKRGNRYVMYFGRLAPAARDKLKKTGHFKPKESGQPSASAESKDGSEESEDESNETEDESSDTEDVSIDSDDEGLDQEDNLVIQLIDMRPKCRSDPSPRRTPVYYAYEGRPKDWSNQQAVKCLNDRRAQAIDRITMDAPWTETEREYLLELLETYPKASIWELTERHNDKFKDKEHTVKTAFSFTSLSKGRTVESVRHEYVTYKSWYDLGDLPTKVRFHTDSSAEGNAIRKSNVMEETFGPPSKILELEFDRKEAARAARAAKKAKAANGDGSSKTADAVENAENCTPDHEMPEDEAEEPVYIPRSSDKLSEDDEELLELSGAYAPSVPVVKRTSRSRSQSPRYSPYKRPSSRNSSLSSRSVSRSRSRSSTRSPEASPAHEDVQSEASDSVTQAPASPTGSTAGSSGELGSTEGSPAPRSANSIDLDEICEGVLSEVINAVATPSASPTNSTGAASSSGIDSSSDAASIERSPPPRPARSVELDESYDDDEML